MNSKIDMNELLMFILFEFEFKFFDIFFHVLAHGFIFKIFIIEDIIILFDSDFLIFKVLLYMYDKLF